MGFIGLMGFVGCDKIDEGEYTVYAGVTFEWGTGTPIANPVQRAYVEKYTGPQCPNCPFADETLNSAHDRFGDNLVIISVNHPTGQGEPYEGEPDMRTQDGNTWDQYFGIETIPTAYINRNKSVKYSGKMANITDGIASTTAESPQVALEVSAISSGRQLLISANMQFITNVESPLTLTLALTEDSLKYMQVRVSTLYPEYSHNHMLRDVITDVWGTNIDINGTAGETYRGTCEYLVTNQDIKLENCHVVALISDKNSRQVLNCAECSIQ